MAYAQPGVGKNRVYGVGEGQESFQSIPERAPHLKGTCVWKLLTVISQQPTLEMSRNVLRRVDDRGKLPRWFTLLSDFWILLRRGAIFCFSRALSGHIIYELGQGQAFDFKRGPFLWPVSKPFSLPYCFVLHILSSLAHLVMIFEGCIITCPTTPHDLVVKDKQAVSKSYLAAKHPILEYRNISIQPYFF